MEEQRRDWVITTHGRVVRRDKAKEKDVIEDKVFDYDNSFPTKEDAYFTRDGIISDYPDAFLYDGPADEDDKPKDNKTDMPRKKIVTQEDFREMAREECSKRLDVFWNEWDKLKGMAKCETFLKMLAYGFSRAPSEKALDADAAERKADKKRQDAAAKISQGLPNNEDEDFEDEP